MDSKALTIILLVASALILALEISIFVAVIPGKIEGLEAYKRQVNSSLSDQDFIKELISQNSDYRQRISALEGEIAEQGIIISRMAEKLNMSASIPTSPFRRVERDDISVYNDRVVILVNKAFAVSFTDSKSMYPFISGYSYAIEVKPQSPDELKVGDIIGYESKALNTSIIHRIISIGYDDQGWFAIAKGDNNPAPDPDPVRFGNIQGVLVGLIY